jgi:hypothetical protein
MGLFCSFFFTLFLFFMISRSELLRFILSRSARNESFNPFRVGALLRHFPRLHLGLFIFNPFRVGALLRHFPRLHLGLFIFNPFRVGALLRHFPRLHLGLFIFNPFRVGPFIGTQNKTRVKNFWQQI